MPKEPTKAASTNGIVGLLATDSMLIRFAGRDYDLANLSADDEAYLRKFPDQVPYLQKTLDVSNPAND